jgi:hypothetical protein
MTVFLDGEGSFLERSQQSAFYACCERVSRVCGGARRGDDRGPAEAGRYN